MEALGRWFSENTASKVYQINYQVNVNTRATFTMADFVPDDLSHSYIIPRGRCLDVGDLDAIIADHDFCIIINYLVPEIIDATMKVRDLYNGISDDQLASRS